MLPAGCLLGFLLPWRWWQYVPPKHQWTSVWLHSITSWKIVSIVITSNPTEGLSVRSSTRGGICLFCKVWGYSDVQLYIVVREGYKMFVGKVAILSDCQWDVHRVFPCFRTPVSATHDTETIHVAENKEGRGKWAFWQDWNYGVLSTYNSAETSLLRYVLNVVRAVDTELQMYSFLTPELM
jgi:hypothetical protein